jgi:hypothetical protein
MTTTKDIIPEETLEGARLERIGRGHYRIWSSSQPEVAYSVDVTHYGGLGSCTCPDFTMRRLPRWRGVRKPYDSFRCRHLRRVRNHIMDQIIKYMKDHKGL